MTKKKKLTLFVSSTVYENRKLLSQLYPILSGFGYEVWMSHKGTVPINPGETTFQSCLRAAGQCDLFLGIITPSYGSGVGKSGPSIIHKEIKRAIELNKPRWLLAHSEVVFARRLLRDLGHNTPKKRGELQLKPGATSITDLRVIDMYEDAIRHSEPELAMRTGNWVQEFNSDNDVLLFVETQLSRIDEIERIIKENITKPKSARTKPKNRKGGAK
jgi:hypothetical protein